MRRSYVQDPETGKLVPREEWVDRRERTHFVHGDIDSFTSPIDGRVISDRGHLRAHNKEHGVTDSRDYSPEFIAKRAKERGDRARGNTAQDRAERIELIRRAID